MKTPSFWYQPPSFYSKILAPLGALYGLAGRIRRAQATPYKPSVPLICVGNVTAGGTGKTPTSIALAGIIKSMDETANPVFVTRGYGGKEKGPLYVDLSHHGVEDVGDEALLLAEVAPCAVGRNRAETIRAEEEMATHIILDDGLQNPTFEPSLSLMVVDGGAGFGNECLIPAGPMRETLDEATKRIDAVILIGDDTHGVTKRISKPILRAHFKTILPPSFLTKPNVLAFAGIGRPEKFYTSCREAGLSVDATQDFPDHHVFTYKELQALETKARSENLRLITTAKDYVRLPDLFRSKVGVLEIQLVFDRDDDVKALLKL